MKIFCLLSVLLTLSIATDYEMEVSSVDALQYSSVFTIDSSAAHQVDIHVPVDFSTQASDDVLLIHLEMVPDVPCGTTPTFGVYADPSGPPFSTASGGPTLLGRINTKESEFLLRNDDYWTHTFFVRNCVGNPLVTGARNIRVQMEETDGWCGSSMELSFTVSARWLSMLSSPFLLPANGATYSLSVNEVGHLSSPLAPTLSGTPPSGPASLDITIPDVALENDVFGRVFAADPTSGECSIWGTSLLKNDAVNDQRAACTHDQQQPFFLLMAKPDPVFNSVMVDISAQWRSPTFVDAAPMGSPTTVTLEPGNSTLVAFTVAGTDLPASGPYYWTMDHAASSPATAAPIMNMAPRPDSWYDLYQSCFPSQVENAAQIGLECQVGEACTIVHPGFRCHYNEDGAEVCYIDRDSPIDRYIFGEVTNPSEITQTFHIEFNFAVGAVSPPVLDSSLARAAFVVSDRLSSQEFSLFPPASPDDYAMHAGMPVTIQPAFFYTREVVYVETTLLGDSDGLIHTAISNSSLTTPDPLDVMSACDAEFRDTSFLVAGCESVQIPLQSFGTRASSYTTPVLAAPCTDTAYHLSPLHVHALAMGEGLLTLRYSSTGPGSTAAGLGTPFSIPPPGSGPVAIRMSTSIAQSDVVSLAYEPITDPTWGQPLVVTTVDENFDVGNYGALSRALASQPVTLLTFGAPPTQRGVIKAGSSTGVPFSVDVDKLAADNVVEVSFDILLGGCDHDQVTVLEVTDDKSNTLLSTSLCPDYWTLGSQTFPGSYPGGGSNICGTGGVKTFVTNSGCGEMTWTFTIPVANSTRTLTLSANYEHTVTRDAPVYFDKLVLRSEFLPPTVAVGAPTGNTGLCLRSVDESHHLVTRYPTFYSADHGPLGGFSSCFMPGDDGWMFYMATVGQYDAPVGLNPLPLVAPHAGDDLTSIQRVSVSTPVSTQVANIGPNVIFVDVPVQDRPVGDYILGLNITVHDFASGSGIVLSSPNARRPDYCPGPDPPGMEYLFENNNSDEIEDISVWREAQDTREVNGTWSTGVSHRPSAWVKPGSSVFQPLHHCPTDDLATSVTLDFPNPYVYSVEVVTVDFASLPVLSPSNSELNLGTDSGPLFVYRIDPEYPDPTCPYNMVISTSVSQGPTDSSWSMMVGAFPTSQEEPMPWGGCSARSALRTHRHMSVDNPSSVTSSPQLPNLGTGLLEAETTAFSLASSMYYNRRDIVPNDAVPSSVSGMIGFAFIGNAVDDVSFYHPTVGWTIRGLIPPSASEFDAVPRYSFDVSVRVTGAGLNTVCVPATDTSVDEVCAALFGASTMVRPVDGGRILVSEHFAFPTVVLSEMSQDESLQLEVMERCLAAYLVCDASGNPFVARCSSLCDVAASNNGPSTERCEQALPDAALGCFVNMDSTTVGFCPATPVNTGTGACPPSGPAPDCNDRGTCVFGNCQCDFPWAGEDCTTCTRDCQHGTSPTPQCHADGTCVCPPSGLWTGDNCELPVCDNPACGTDEACFRYQSCTCPYSFGRREGDSCTPCCSGVGECDFVNQECECLEGFYGNDCETHCGSVHCSGHGECFGDSAASPGECVCSGGFTGTDCSVCDDNICSGHGVCSAAPTVPGGSCACDLGWTGELCDIPICSLGCGEGGYCAAPDVCECHDGWYSVESVCDRQCGDDHCGGRGLCRGTFLSPSLCECDYGFSGPACESCADNLCDHGTTSCNANGRQICTCDPGWQGLTCEQPICSSGCPDREYCSWPETCSCQAPFIPHPNNGRCTTWEESRVEESYICWHDLICVRIWFARICIPYPRFCTRWVWGDPHYISFDGHSFVFNGKGEFVATRSLGLSDPVIDVEVQVRQEPCGQGNATCITAVAAIDRVHDESVTVLTPLNSPSGKAMEVRVGALTVFDNQRPGGLNMTSLGWNGVLALNSTRFQLRQNASETSQDLTIIMGGGELVATIVVQSGSTGMSLMPGQLMMNNSIGLYGLMNTNPDDDLTKPDMTLAGSTAEFGESWRVGSVLESLFDRRTGEATFAEVQDATGFTPDEEFVESQHDPAFFAAANRTCSQRMGLTGALLDSCVYDVLTSRSMDRALSAVIVSARDSELLGANTTTDDDISSAAYDLLSCPNGCSGKGVCNPQTGACQCFDGYGGSPDCKGTYVAPVCGNGVRDGLDFCDAGAANSDLPNAASGCRTDCTLVRCGDGIVDDVNDEECDGTVGCSSACTLSAGTTDDSGDDGGDDNDSTGNSPAIVGVAIASVVGIAAVSVLCMVISGQRQGSKLPSTDGESTASK